MKTIRWGILGPGHIAQDFAHSLTLVEGAELRAVASRDLARAKALARPYGARALEGYQALLEDPDIDAVYIATPHPMHHQQAIDCLRARKAVLCEKPLAVNLRQAHEMIEAARQHDTYLMEALWKRFKPSLLKARDWINQGAIGRPLYLTADFSFASTPQQAPRLFDPALAGGSLLDAGVYPISLAIMLLGRPETVGGVASLAPNGIDEQAAICLRFECGALASLHSGVTVKSANDLVVYGEKGHIRLENFISSDHAALFVEGEAPQVWDQPYPGKGFVYEIQAMCEDLRAGRKQNAVMPHEDSLSVMRVTDTLRKSWGLRYPFE